MDGIDLRDVQFRSSPNVADWPITVTLNGVEFKSGTAAMGNTCGVRPIFDRTEMNARWPDVKPPDWTGAIQFTLWAFVRIGGVWYGAALQEFWSNRNGEPRIWSGAPILTQWSDWVYRNQWGPELEGYRPKVGDPIAFMLTAGDRRLMDVGDVRERTNVLLTTLQADAVVEGVTAVEPPPVSVIPPPDQPPTNTGVDLAMAAEIIQLKARLTTLEAQHATLYEFVTERQKTQIEEARQSADDAKVAADAATARVAKLELTVEAYKKRVDEALNVAKGAGGFLAGLFTKRG